MTHDLCVSYTTIESLQKKPEQEKGKARPDREPTFK
jgi:hypothetical protein